MSSSGCSLRLRSPTPTSVRGSNRRLPPLRRRIPSSTSEPVDILPKSSSEPLLPGLPAPSPTSVSDVWLYRHMTCTDLLSPSPTLLSQEPLQSPNEVYQKDTKVVVTVTVEGSPGPIRTMVKLGTSVDETIKLLIQKYDKEGRFPWLDQNAASVYELHLSYFSLECLDRAKSIGDVGSRSFYLRKGKTTSHVETTMLKASSDEDVVGVDAAHLLARTWPWPSMLFLPAYVTRKTSKVVRRMRKLWKVLGCLHCSS